MKIKFLHIPKTAGQSIHFALLDVFGEKNICPARTNQQLLKLRISEINRYQVLSGHFDWSLVDCFRAENEYSFTVIRNPMDRIFSFYFFTKKNSENLSSLNEADRVLYHCAHNDINSFFIGNGEVYEFIKDHYDNFYAYYFAGRTYDARRRLRSAKISKNDIIDMAIDNMLMLDDVYTLDNIQKVFSTVYGFSSCQKEIKEYKNNVNKKFPSEDRLQQIKELGANDQLINMLGEFCEMDDIIFKKFG